MFLSLCSSYLAAPWAAQAADNAEHAKVRSIVDAAIQPLMAAHDVPGMAVAVSVDGRAFFFNYGVASKAASTRVSERTIFELGSVSKTFTATLAAYAQATGKLSLDDHPGQYLPQLQGQAIDKASLLHLGTYTAGGLPLQFPDGVPNDQGGMVDYFRQWKPEAEPGVQRRYSNPSIGLLGHITGLAMRGGKNSDNSGGNDFAVALETRLFPKFGLRHTHVRVPPSAMARYAWGYDKTNKPVRVNPGLFADESYGAKSTSADMIRFVQANINPGAVTKEAALQHAVETTQVGRFQAGGMVQGLGWEQYAYPAPEAQLLAGNATGIVLEANPVQRVPPQQQASAGDRLFNKTGSTNGFGAYVAFVPAKRIGIVMLANKNYPVPARVKAAFAILSQVAPAAKP